MPIEKNVKKLYTVIEGGDFVKILNFGSCNADYVYSVAHIVSPGETVKSEKLSLFPGGKGLNQSISLKRAGAEVFHAGLIGNDGLFLKELLSGNSVNTDFLETCDDKTGQAIIQVEKNGENAILLYPGANEKITPEYADHVLSHFSADDVIVLQNEISCTPYIIDAAFKKGMKIILNPSPFNEKLSDIDYSKLYLLILNQTEGAALTGKTDTREIKEHITKKYPSLHTVLTLGKKGAEYFKANKSFYMPAFNVKAADTTGAGDTFTGFFVAEFLKTEDPETALKLATAAAAIAVTENGAASSIPWLFEVQKFLSERNAI